MKKIAALSIFLFGVIVCTVYRFQHPSFSETRLFIELWWVIAIMIFVPPIILKYADK